MTNTIELINDDCIHAMQSLIDDEVKVDLILTDPPYGTTQCRWDTVIPYDEMWSCVKELRRDSTPILLFGTEPFSSYLRLSNINEYRYDLIWNKKKGTNFLNANRMPMQSHEVINVFYKKLPYYNPQKKYVGVKDKRKGGISVGNGNRVYGNFKKVKGWKDDGYRFPLSVIECDKTHTEAHNSIRVHPTQKPVKLLEYFIKTYTDEDDTVLDFTMGSGSTGVACQNTNRSFIGIELEKEYYDIAVKRLNNNNKQSKLI